MVLCATLVKIKFSSETRSHIAIEYLWAFQSSLTIFNIIIVSCIDKTSSKLKNKTYVSRLDAWAPRTWLVTGVASKSGQTGHQESGVTLIGNH